MSTRRPCFDATERAHLDAFNALDPAARALVLDILGIFVADAIASASDPAAVELQPARGSCGTDATETERREGDASPTADRRPTRPDHPDRGSMGPGGLRCEADDRQLALGQGR